METSPKFSFKAILLGFLADLSGSTVIAVIAGFIAGMSLVANGIRPDDLPKAILASSTLRWVALVSGAVFVGVGGYVAARVAGEHEMPNALGVAAVNLVISVPALLLGPFTGTTGMTFLSMILTIPAALAGAKLRLHEVA